MSSSFVPASAGASTLMHRYILSILSFKLPSPSNFRVTRTCLGRSNLILHPPPAPVMAGFPTNSLRLAAVISGKIIILAFGYGFLEAVLHFEYLAPPNQVGNLWRLYPEELTMVVTLIATVLSVATTMCVCPSTLPNYFST